MLKECPGSLEMVSNWGLIDKSSWFSIACILHQVLIGIQLRLRQRQQELIRFDRKPDPRLDLRVPAPGQAKKVAMLDSLNYVAHELIVHTSLTKRSSDFVAHLEQIDALYGPMPGRAGKPVVLVEDNGPIHVSKLSRAAFALARTG